MQILWSWGGGGGDRWGKEEKKGGGKKGKKGEGEKKENRRLLCTLYIPLAVVHSAQSTKSYIFSL